MGEETMDKRTAAMGPAPIGPLLLRVSIPAMVSVVMASLYNIIDTLWVSGLPNGTEAIPALAVLMPLQQVASAMGMGFRSLVLTMSRRVIFVIPALFILSDTYGVYGAFAAQPLSDVLGLFIAGGMLLRAYRQYPAMASAQ